MVGLCGIATVLACAVSSNASVLNCYWAMWPHTAKFCHQYKQDNPHSLGTLQADGFGFQVADAGHADSENRRFKVIISGYFFWSKFSQEKETF